MVDTLVERLMYPLGTVDHLSLVEREIVMYCTINFKTKKALKDAVKQRVRWHELHPPNETDLERFERKQTVGAVLSDKEFPNGEPPIVTLFQPNNMFDIVACINGIETVEGPHNPRPHTWYARCTIKDGEVVKVS